MSNAERQDKSICIAESKTMFWGGFFWVLLGAAVYFILIPWQIADEAVESGTSARYIPSALSGLMMLFGALLAANGYLNRNAPDQHEYRFNLINMRLVLFTLVIIGGNIIAFNLVGYLIPAMATMAILMLLYGNRSYIKIALYSVLIPIVISQSFKMALQLYLP